MNIIYGTNFNHSTGRYEDPRKHTPTPTGTVAGASKSTPYTLEQLSKDIHSGTVTNQDQLDNILRTRGYEGNTQQNRVSVSSSSSASRVAGASTTAGGGLSRSTATPTVAGRTANSAGAFYGSAGTNTMGTSFDSAGNPILGTLGNRNIIGGQGSRVDRTGGVPQDPMSQYMAMFSPQGAMDRQAQIRKDMARERQQQIDAIEMSSRQAVSREQDAGAQDLARQRSMNLRAGLGGSDFGASNKAEIRTRTNDRVAGIEAQRDMAIGGAIDRIEQLAQSRFQIEQNAMQQGFSNLMQVQQYTQAQEQQMREQTLESLKTLGQSGMDIQTIKSRDPDLYEKLTTASGMSDVEVEAVLNNARPAPERTDYQYKVMGNKLIAYGVDPVTGQLKTMEQEVDMPDNYSVTTMPDGTVLGVPDAWDGDTSKIIRVGNYAKPMAGAGGGGGASGVMPGYAAVGLGEAEVDRLNQIGLSPAQQELVSAIMRGDSPPIPPNNPRTKDIQMVLAGLGALGFDNTKAVQDWTSMQKRLQSMNSTQQVRLFQAVGAMEGSVEQADRLYKEWQSTGLASGFSIFNKAALVASANLPGEKGAVARTLLSHIEDMSAELATIYRGGNSPTDAAFASAQKSLSAYWNPETFQRNLELIRQNLRIRKNTMASATQVMGNQYSPEMAGASDVFQDQQQDIPQTQDAMNAMNAPVGSEVVINGKTYKKTGEDNYEEVKSGGFWSNLFRR